MGKYPLECLWLGSGQGSAVTDVPLGGSFKENEIGCDTGTNLRSDVAGSSP